jgi:hypothetical protein
VGDRRPILEDKMADTIYQYSIGEFHQHNFAGTVEVAGTATVDKLSVLHDVLIHINPAGTAGTVTVTYDSALGTVYDTVLSSTTLGTASSKTDIVYTPTSEQFMRPGDAVVVAWANAQNAQVGALIDIEGLK